MQWIESLFGQHQKGKYGLSGLTDELFSLYVSKTLATEKSDILLVTNTLFEATKLFQSISKYTDNAYLFPMDDFLTSEALAISPDLKVSRLEAINNIIANKKPIVIVTHLMGFLRYLPSKKVWEDSIIEIKAHQQISKEKLLRQLNNIGYIMETLVTKTGEVGNRGFILDVFPINESNPIRIEFWGDEIEAIRYFDTESQLSLNNIDNITIYPFDEFVLPDLDFDGIRKQKYLPAYTNQVSSIGGYLSNPIVIYKDYNQIKNAYLMLREEIFNYSRNDGGPKTNYMHELESLSYDNEIFLLSADDTLPEKKLKVSQYHSKEAPLFNGNLAKINEDIKHYLALGKTVVICLKDDWQIKNFSSFIDISYQIVKENNIAENKLNIVKFSITNGYIIDNLVVLGETNLFKKTDNDNVYKSNFKYGSKIKDINKLKVGDYVVHAIHGIGIYSGIETLNKRGLQKDYLLINYKDKDKLYIPVEKIDLIAKYASKEGYVPNINKLGGTEWHKTKQRVKNKIKDIADKLLRISAEREAKQGFAFSSDTEEQLMFEKDFIYEETRDQLIAIKQIKADMEKRSPMDRLLCGDVGYGKTEVAFRAVFKAVLDSKQVAYLCPTTILSNQQYENALNRFKNYPVNIALLNRFTTPKQVKEIINGLAKGTIDFVIGTHRLLSKDVNFKDLGLLIVDEEQRFGVTHKERIKEYKANIDILTLSATPIPRTLQMSLLGIRNLSLIETPPMNRYPIQTYVLEQSDHIIREVIYKELSRGGQVFLLYNKVENITERVAKISQLVPDAKVTYAHGQMSKSQIEDTMLKFINHDYDVLVCTTIIETGIDIANVNTLIIIDADRFGLSQLYQIRGRVGRSNKIAYAYLMYNSGKVLSEIAIRRLNAIKEFTELGSGFSIAMRDLSIRGAGDILGSEQAGFIDTVGIELYTKMLEEEINHIKGQRVDKEEIVEEMPLLEVDTHIDDEYINNDDLKIEIHRKINGIDSYEKLLQVKQEIEDRFGKTSESMLIYMYEEWFEKMAPMVGIDKVNQNDTAIELIFTMEATNKLEINNLFIEAHQINPNFRFTYQNKRLKIVLNILKLEKHWLYYIVELVKRMHKIEYI